MTLIKEDNRISEQTFGVSLSFRDPCFSIHPATLHLYHSSGPFDYSIGGFSTAAREISPDQSKISDVTIFLFPDDLLEGIEEFSIYVGSIGGIFPNFQLPVSNSMTTTPAFASTLVRILDNDCKHLEHSEICL